MLSTVGNGLRDTAFAPLPDGTARVIERGVAATSATDATTGAVLNTKGGSSLSFRFAADGSLVVVGTGWIFAWYLPGDDSDLGAGLFLLHGRITETYDSEGHVRERDLQRHVDRRVRGARRLTRRSRIETARRASGGPFVGVARRRGASCSRRATRSGRAMPREPRRPSGTACRSRGRGRAAEQAAAEAAELVGRDLAVVHDAGELAERAVRGELVELLLGDHAVGEERPELLALRLGGLAARGALGARPSRIACCWPR